MGWARAVEAPPGMSTKRATPCTGISVATRSERLAEAVFMSGERLAETQAKEFPALLTANLHVLPYFLGNRSPNADPHATGIIEGVEPQPLVQRSSSDLRLDPFPLSSRSAAYQSS